MTTLVKLHRGKVVVFIVALFSALLVLTAVRAQTQAQAQAQVSPGAKIYVTESNSNTLSAINPNNDTITSTLRVRSSPNAVVLHPIGNLLYVATIRGVQIVNTTNNTVTGFIPADLSVGQPANMAINSNGTRLYAVGNVNAAAGVIVINPISQNIVANVNIQAQWVVLHPDSSRYYISSTAVNGITVVDINTNNPITTIPTNSGTFGMAIKPDGSRLYVAEANNIFIIDATNDTIVGTPIPISPDTPVLVTYNPVLSRLYVASSTRGDDRIFVFDATNPNTLTLIGQPIPVGGAPIALALNPAGTRLYVANKDSNNISVIDTTNNTEINTIPVGFAPAGLVFRP